MPEPFICISCLLGLHEECGWEVRCKCNVCKGTAQIDTEAAVNGSETISDETDEQPNESEERTRSHKRDAAIRDPESTGRKRAAKKYPLDRNAPCEWLGKVQMGGGAFPIDGCSNGKQQARHHGPDKNTLNNEEGNVHRICHGCHNRWHAKNDPDYNPNSPILKD